MDGNTTPEDTQSRTYRMRWWTLAVVSVTVLLATIDETILNVAIPSLQRDLGASASSLQWMINSYLLVFGGLLLTMGGAADRFGRARMLRYGLAVFALSSLGAALAQFPGQLIGARAIMGMGGAMMMPPTLAVIVNVFEEKERPKAIAIWAMMAGVGVALGPILGGALLEYFYWGSVFLVNVPIAGIAIAASLFLVPDSRDPRSRPLDIPGALLSMGAVSALVLAIIEGPTWGGSVPAARDYGSHGGDLGPGLRPAREADRIPIAGLCAVPRSAVFDRSSRYKSGILLDSRLHVWLHAVPPARSGTHSAGRGNSIPPDSGGFHGRRHSQ